MLRTQLNLAAHGNWSTSERQTPAPDSALPSFKDQLLRYWNMGILKKLAISFLVTYVHVLIQLRPAFKVILVCSLRYWLINIIQFMCLYSHCLYYWRYRTSLLWLQYFHCDCKGIHFCRVFLHLLLLGSQTSTSFSVNMRERKIQMVRERGRVCVCLSVGRMS